MNYIINPVIMAGTVTEISEPNIKINLNGRLGVFDLGKDMVTNFCDLKKEDKVQFYFSYIQVVDENINHDITGLVTHYEMFPCLVNGVIIESNDTAIKVSLPNSLGTISVPRRWVFSPVKLENGLNVEFYLSNIN